MNNRLTRILGILAMFVTGALSLADDQSFFLLTGKFADNEDYTKGQAISDDGKTIAGLAFLPGHEEAFIWNIDDGFTQLGNSNDDVYIDFAWAITRDATYVAAASNAGRSARWSAAGGAEDLGQIDADHPSSLSFGISDDGGVLVGRSWGDKTSWAATRWSHDDGWIYIGDPSTLSSEAFACSADGSIVVGHMPVKSDRSFIDRAFIWTKDDGRKELGGDGNAPNYSIATAITGDGKFVAGYSTDAKVGVFRWSSDTGFDLLGTPSTDHCGLRTRAISSDGRVIVGSLCYAWMWRDKIGFRSLNELAAEVGLDTSKIVFVTAYAVTGDGRTITGDAIDTEANVRQAYILHVSDPGYPRGDVNCDGTVDFNDIDAFVVALIGRTEFEQQYPGCNLFRADVNCDRAVDFDDIDGFVNCIVNGQCDACP